MAVDGGSGQVGPRVAEMLESLRSQRLQNLRLTGKSESSFMMWKGMKKHRSITSGSCYGPARLE